MPGDQIQLACTFELFCQVCPINRRTGSGFGPKIQISFCQIFGYQISQYGYCRITYHTSGITGSQRPFRQDGSFHITLYQRISHIRSQRRIDNRHQRMQGTERIPQRERRIIRITGCGCMHFLVHTQITTIHILISKRGNHRMVKRGIEVLPDHRIVGFDLDLVQCLVPDISRFGTNLIEVPSRQFGFHILFRSFHIYRRKCYFYQQRLIRFLKPIVELQIFIGMQFEEQGIRTHLSIYILIDLGHRFRESHPIRNGMEMRPTLCLIRSFYR